MSNPERSCPVLAMMCVALAGCPGEPAGVPATLDAVEAGAEDTFDQALAGDLGQARAAAAALATAWANYQPIGEADHAPVEALADVEAALAALPAALVDGTDATTAARAANAASEPMPRLYAGYDPVVPVAVLELDYRGRELLLDGRDADFALAAGELAAITRTWADLGPQVEAAGGAAAAGDLAAAIDLARGAVDARDGTAVVAAAAAELEAVDAVEAVFATPDPAD